jgi:hypothetical protein
VRRSVAEHRPDQVSAEVRAMVAEVVRDVVSEVARGSSRSPAASVPPASPASPAPVLDRPQPTGPAKAAGRSRVETVRLTGSTDLQRFALRLLELYDNPKTREDVRTGRLSFELAGGVAAPAAPGAVERVERGAVTERTVAAAATTGARLVLGPRAVLTPLGREKARALGVVVEKERR